MKNEKAEGILIVPMFTIQAWFPKEIKILTRQLVKLPATCKSFYFRCSLEVEPNLPKMQLIACFISKNIGKTLEIRQIFQRFFYIYGDQALDSSTTAICFL